MQSGPGGPSSQGRLFKQTCQLNVNYKFFAGAAAQESIHGLHLHSSSQSLLGMQSGPGGLPYQGKHVNTNMSLRVNNNLFAGAASLGAIHGMHLNSSSQSLLGMLSGPGGLPYQGKHVNTNMSVNVNNKLFAGAASLGAIHGLNLNSSSQSLLGMQSGPGGPSNQGRHIHTNTVANSNCLFSQ